MQSPWISPQAGSGDFQDETRANETHESKSDPDARLCRKSNAATKQNLMGNMLSDNRQCLIASAAISVTNGYTEREEAKLMSSNARQALEHKTIHVALDADKGNALYTSLDSISGGSGRPRQVIDS